MSERPEHLKETMDVLDLVFTGIDSYRDAFQDGKFNVIKDSDDVLRVITKIPAALRGADRIDDEAAAYSEDDIQFMIDHYSDMYGGTETERREAIEKIIKGALISVSGSVALAKLPKN